MLIFLSALHSPIHIFISRIARDVIELDYKTGSLSSPVLRTGCYFYHDQKYRQSLTFISHIIRGMLLADFVNESIRKDFSSLVLRMGCYSISICLAVTTAGFYLPCYTWDVTENSIMDAYDNRFSSLALRARCYPRTQVRAHRLRHLSSLVLRVECYFKVIPFYVGSLFLSSPALRARCYFIFTHSNIILYFSSSARSARCYKTPPRLTTI